MPRRRLVNLLLFCLVLALGALAWLTPEQQAQNGLKPLTGIEPGSINRLRLQNRSGADIVIERRGDGWRMVSPYAIAADPERIRLLLGILATPSLERFPAPAGSLTEFGLDPPLATLELDGARLSVGGTHPYNHRRYLLLDATLHLIDDRLPRLLMAGSEEFVSRMLLPEGGAPTAIEAPGWSIRRNAANHWQLEPASTVPLTTDQLRNKVEEWRGARALRVTRAVEGEVSGEARVELQGTAEPVIFQLQSVGGKLLLVRPGIGIAYHLPDGLQLLALPGEP